MKQKWVLAEQILQNDVHSDQPVWSVFAVAQWVAKAWKILYVDRKEWSECFDGQADLGLRCRHVIFADFVVYGLNLI